MNKISNDANIINIPKVITAGLGIGILSLLILILGPFLLAGQPVYEGVTTTAITEEIHAYPTNTNTITPVVERIFASIVRGRVKLIQDGSITEFTRPGDSIVRSAGIQIESVTNCELDLLDTSILIMDQESMIEQGDFYAGIFLLHRGRILLNNFSLSVRIPETKYTVKGRRAVMVVEYSPDLGEFWVECLIGECQLLADETVTLSAGQSAGLQQGSLQLASKADYSKWENIYSGHFSTPTATQTSTPTARPSPSPNVSPSPSPTITTNPIIDPTAKPSHQPSKTPVKTPGTQG